MIKKLMQTLDLTEDEARQLIADDEKIDKGEKLFELSADQKKASKQARQTARAVNAYGKTVNRERKIDTDKRELITAITKTLENLADSGTVEVNNLEREIEFIYHNRKFKIVLSAPRK